MWFTKQIQECPTAHPRREALHLQPQAELGLTNTRFCEKGDKRKKTRVRHGETRVQLFKRKQGRDGHMTRGNASGQGPSAVRTTDLAMRKSG